MIYKAENIDNITIDGENYPVSGLTDLPITPDQAAAHGLTPATADEEAAFADAAKSGGKRGGKGNKDDEDGKDNNGGKDDKDGSK